MAAETRTRPRTLYLFSRDRLPSLVLEVKFKLYLFLAIIIWWVKTSIAPIVTLRPTLAFISRTISVRI